MQVDLAALTAVFIRNLASVEKCGQAVMWDSAGLGGQSLGEGNLRGSLPETNSDASLAG